MKIAMAGSWNTDAGPSIHAEPIGKEWVKKGIDLEILSFYRHSFHGTTFTKTPEEEEKYVKRCFGVYDHLDVKIDPDPFLKDDYDIFVVQDLGMLPLPQLIKIYPAIKKKAKTVNIIHDGAPSDRPEFYKFDFDAVVCFDQRYKDFLKDNYPEEKIHIIPFPADTYKPGDKMKAREELGLPKDKKIVFTFGPASEFTMSIHGVLDRLTDKYDVLLVVATFNENIIRGYRDVKPNVKFDLKIIEKMLERDVLYKYLHAADCLVYNKGSMPCVVVASTIFQCMGSMCPILAYESNFIHTFNEEVIKYSNFYELEEDLADVFEEKVKYKNNQRAVVSYLEQNSAGPISEKFLGLFESLLKTGGKNGLKKI